MTVALALPAAAPLTRPIPSRPIDWFFVIVELERHGYTLRTISMSIGRSKGTIGGWRCGDHEPGHEGGEGLINLWLAVTGKRREDLPRRLAVGLSAARAGR